MRKVQRDEDKTTGWRDTLRLAVATNNEDEVRRTFSFLVTLDRQQIEVRAKAFLKQFAPSYLADEDLMPETMEYQLKMDLFNASVIAYLEGQGVDIKISIEHGIETWIEANTPAIVSANLKRMEEALGTPSVETHQDRGLCQRALCA